MQNIWNDLTPWLQLENDTKAHVYNLLQNANRSGI